MPDLVVRRETEVGVQHKLPPAAMFTVIHLAMISGIQFSSQGCPEPHSHVTGHHVLFGGLLSQNPNLP